MENMSCFGADMSFSSNKKKQANKIYVLERDEIQGVTTVGPTVTKKTQYKKEQQSIRREYTRQTLQNQTKNLYYHYTTMVMILICLLMVVKN